MNQNALWTELATGSETARQQILAQHIGLVHFVARKISRGLRVDFDFDDLVSSGTLGLISAVDSFDASRGLAFSTYATPRIRGAILDELRRQDHLPRTMRRRTRDLKTARENLGRAAGAPPSDTEVAAELGIDLETLWRWEADAESATQVSLDGAAPSGDEDGISGAELLAGSVETGIDDEINLSQEVEFLRDAILELKEQERVVLSLYYYEDLKLHEIAVALGVTESRVSQIRTKALANLRTKLSSLREPAAPAPRRRTQPLMARQFAHAAL